MLLFSLGTLYHKQSNIDVTHIQSELFSCKQERFLTFDSYIIIFFLKEFRSFSCSVRTKKEKQEKHPYDSTYPNGRNTRNIKAPVFLPASTPKKIFSVLKIRALLGSDRSESFMFEMVSAFVDNIHEVIPQLFQ